MKADITVSLAYLARHDHTATELEVHVQDVNALGQRIAELNIRIGEIEANGVAANDLRDQRDRVVRDLAELADVRAIEDKRGGLRNRTSSLCHRVLRFAPSARAPAKRWR